MSWGWSKLLAESVINWNSSHESIWTPPSLSAKASTAASTFSLEVSEQCSGVGGWLVLGGEIFFGGEKRGLPEDKATEIKEENNTKTCSVCSEASLSESSEVCFGHRERAGADCL